MCLDLARDLRVLWNMRVIPIVIVALGTVPKGLEKGAGRLNVGGRAETIQTKLSRSTRILRRVLET